MAGRGIVKKIFSKQGGLSFTTGNPFGQLILASGSFTRPTNTGYITFIVVGGGSGGGGGQTAAVSAGGGGGGASGGISIMTCLASRLPSTLYFFAGGGGAGGPADTNGSIGIASAVAISNIAAPSTQNPVLKDAICIAPGGGLAGKGLAGTGGAGGSGAVGVIGNNLALGFIGGQIMPMSGIAGALGGSATTGTALDVGIANTVFLSGGTGGAGISAGAAVFSGGVIIQTAGTSPVFTLPSPAFLATNSSTPAVGTNNLGTVLYPYSIGGLGMGSLIGTPAKAGSGGPGCGGGGGGGGSVAGGVGGDGGNGFLLMIY